MFFYNKILYFNLLFLLMKIKCDSMPIFVPSQKLCQNFNCQCLITWLNAVEQRHSTLLIKGPFLPKNNA